MSPNKTHITALIDGEPVQVRRGATILDAARQAGIYIPTLCYLEGKKSYGGCRLCVVKIKGGRGFPAACTTPLEPGMEIRTKTPELQSLRRSILEMTLSEHPYTCLVCKDKKDCGEFMHSTRKAGTITGCNFCTSNGDCELQDLIDYLDLKDIRYPISYRSIPAEKTNPFYDLDYNLCVLCGRCVRICNEERNSNVLSIVQRGNASIVGTAFGESQISAGCEFCGACVDVCPTGSISGKLGKWAGPPTRSVETTCTLCSIGCTMNVNSRAGKLVDVGPAPGGRMDPSQICIRGKFLAGDILEHPSRITAPMIRRKGRMVEVDWNEAISFTAGKLANWPGNGFGVIGSAQDSLEENYSLQKFSRIVMDSNNIDLISGWPGQGLEDSIIPFMGSTGSCDDILKADTVLVLGTDASVSHPLVENRIRKAYNAGKNVVYANCRLTRTSRFSTIEINYSDCMDSNFLYLLIAELARETIAGLPAGYAEQISQPILDRALKNCSVNEENLNAVIKILAKSRRLCIVVGDELLHGESGIETIKAIRNIQFLKGEKSKNKIILLGNEGSYYGGVFAGAHPGMLPGLDPLNDEKAIRKWNKTWNSKLRKVRGLNYSEMLSNVGRDGISAMMIAGDVPISSKLKKLKFLLQMNMFRTELTEHADVFLPVTGFLENEGHFLSLDGKIRKLRKAVNAPGESRTIPYIISALGKAMKSNGFSASKAGAVWKEIQSNTKIPHNQNGSVQSRFEIMKPAIRSKSGKNGYDFYRYRGNKLYDLVPDLKKVMDGMVSENI